MDFTSRLMPDLGFAGLILKAILFSLAGIFLLIAFIALRRWYRGRYFQRLSERTFALRSQWDGILSGAVPAESWRLNNLDCEIVESILLASIEIADSDELSTLLNCLRRSGLLDMRIHQARVTTGWKRRTALVALGRTRAPEAIPALAEALDAPEEETRIAAVRGLANTELPEAAIPILDCLLLGKRSIPEHTLKNALASCCRHSPGVLLRYLKQSSGRPRELLARVLGELASSDLGEDLILLATDSDAEVRASAARALGNLQPSFALPVLSVMVGDKEWFVRLRAVVALASIKHALRIRPLLHALCDPNRYVRQRSAWALAHIGSNLDDILTQVVETKDNYALQAFISELERSGAIENLVEALENHPGQNAARNILLRTLNVCRQDIEQANKAFAAAGGAK
ncbi:MAG TPA: HEAT repeat domain-containing protein [Candidatus Bathyarchaeia archaeon]|nr:HEAT repeat domain-containing protein [Candidatus Bathyarchaeia archaeon]